MKIIAPLKNCNIDGNLENLKGKCNIEVYCDAHDLLIHYDNEYDMDNEYISHVWINFGEEYNETIFFDIAIDDLELFAHSILKEIEIVRRNYSKQIQYQIDKGFKI